MSEPLLELDDLEVSYHTDTKSLKAVSDASFSIGPNEYFGLVGESGCGKSTLAEAVLNGLDENGEVTGGTVRYKGTEIQDFTEKEFNEKLRWNEIAVIPQTAMNSLNPLAKISEQAIEVANTHTDWTKAQTVEKLEELFEVVGLPESRVHDYPHQFSGGMKQRAIIAFSLLLDPSLIIADEPTTALDVIMQDQFLKYLHDLKEEQDFGMLFITHDISVIFKICDSLGVMHGGQIAEVGSTVDLYNTPRHPYSILLQQSFTDVRYPDRELIEIEGTPPALSEEVSSCSFAERCPWAKSECWADAPPLEPLEENSSQKTSCIRSDEMETLASEYLERHESTEESDVRTDGGREMAPERDGDLRTDGGRDVLADRERGTNLRTDGGRTRVARSDAPDAADADAETVMRLDGLDKHFDQSANVVETLKNRLFGVEEQPVRAVDGVDLDLKRNQVQGIIGESGCGKSTLLQTLMGKYAPTDGEIYLHDEPTSEFAKADWKEFRRRVQIILQDPFNAINPHFTVRQALREPLHVHGLEKNDEKILDVLEQVQLSPAERYIDRHESQLSGGEKQRIAIARALILEPDIILADEPVSMLDVSTQASILRLLDDLVEEYGVSMMYVSHDLSTVSYVCDRINVMYLGRIIENGPTREILTNPKHPYTRALLKAIPIPDPEYDHEWTNIPGSPGDATDLPTGCRFKDRCPERMDVCDTRPRFEAVGEASVEHNVSCHLHYDHESVAGTPETDGSLGGERE